MMQQWDRGFLRVPDLEVLLEGFMKLGEEVLIKIQWLRCLRIIMTAKYIIRLTLHLLYKKTFLKTSNHKESL